MSKAKQEVRASPRSSAQRLGKKTSGKSAKQLDRRLRGVAEALDHHDRRNLRAAFAFGRTIGFAPTTTIDFHPIHMDEYPEGELAVWFRDGLRNRIATWLRRRKVGWYAIWTRENYVGERREHLHLMLYCPPRLRESLKEAIRRWYPGGEKMVKVGILTWRKHPYSGRVVCAGFEYRLKQMTAQAQGPTKLDDGTKRLGRPFRETKNRKDGSPVASVNGLRCGVSKNLDKKARLAWETGHGASPAADEALLEMDMPISVSPVGRGDAAALDPA